MALQKMTPPKLIDKKRRGEKIATITAYDHAMARLVDAAGVDLILVGDSLAMTMLGHPNTLAVTMDEMIHHTRAVTRGVSNAIVVGDMPFLSYKVEIKDAVLNAGRFIREGGAEAVKLEGGTGMVPTIEAIVNADIPVMGHVGLTPQAIYKFGGFTVQARTAAAAKQLLLDAVNLEQAGVFAIVLESIPWPLAKIVTETVHVPTIGIGAGPHCDGQILVIHDMLGMSGFKPKFVKHFGQVGAAITDAVTSYKREVEAGTYPDAAHAYDATGSELDEVRDWLASVDLEGEAAKARKAARDP